LKTVIKIQNLSVAYNEKVVLEDINLELPAGKLIGVIGANGSGKTTMLKSIMGLLPIKSGEVKIFDKNLADIRQKVSYVPQRSLVDWDFPANVLDVVLMGRINPNNIFKSPTQQDRDIAQEAIQKVGLQDFTKRQISQLSGGQQQRVFLARALTQQAEVYLLDEPFVAIDVATENTIIDLLKEMRQAGKTIVVVHHDLQTVAHYFDWVVLLNKTLVASGETLETFQKENLQKTYNGKLNFL
jgi:manganese/zinc/iron transport system ATP- binding protein